MNFRTLNADEIECRVASINEKGLSLLLYKDARVDQNILDETVGAMNWQRHHSRENANCTVAIWDADKGQWVEKEDTGKESFTEAEKGLASDSFKRACFNWGIGRELYTAPFVWVPAENAALEQDKGKWKTTERFRVSTIGYDSKRNIDKLVIRNSKRKIVYSYPKDLKEAPEEKPEEKPATSNTSEPSPETQAKVEKQLISAIKVTALHSTCKNEGIPEDKILKLYKVPNFESLTEKQFSNINANLDKIKAI